MAVKEEEKKPQKDAPKLERKAEKKKEEKGIHTLYKIEGEKVTRLRPTCERCGPGYFMAKHQDRYTCGHCGFTRYRQGE
jgi:small subunit ribosomal protein S27Ae